MLVLGGILMIPLAFPLMTVGGAVVAVIWFGSAWLSRKRKKSKLQNTLKRECGERG